MELPQVPVNPEGPTAESGSAMRIPRSTKEFVEFNADLRDPWHGAGWRWSQ